MNKQEVMHMLALAEEMKHPWRKYPNKVIVHYGDIRSSSLLAYKAASIHLGCDTLTAKVDPDIMDIQTLQYYGDALVVCHPQDTHKWVDTEIPVIQDSNQVQALTDLYTMVQELRFRGIELDQQDRPPIKVTLLGYSRTVQPFVKLLDLFPQIEFFYTQKNEEIPQDTDVLYVCNRQGTDTYHITSAFLKSMKPTMILMHPLPRTSELSSDVDHNPRCVYFKQFRNGLYMHMAILDNALSPTCSPSLWEYATMAWRVLLNRTWFYNA
jgi:hypothetical protein